MRQNDISLRCSGVFVVNCNHIFLLITLNMHLPVENLVFFVCCFIFSFERVFESCKNYPYLNNYTLHN